MESGREIDQPDIEVFDEAPDLLENLDGLAQLLYRHILLSAALKHRRGVNLSPAREVNLSGDPLQLRDRLSPLCVSGCTLLDERNRALGFFEGEQLWHQSMGPMRASLRRA